MLRSASAALAAGAAFNQRHMGPINTVLLVCRVWFWEELADFSSYLKISSLGGAGVELEPALQLAVGTQGFIKLKMNAGEIRNGHRPD